MREVRNARTINRVSARNAGKGDGPEFELDAPGLLDVQEESFKDFLAFIESAGAYSQSGLKRFLIKELEDLDDANAGAKIEEIHVDQDREGEHTLTKQCIASGATYSRPVTVSGNAEADGRAEVLFSIPMMTSRGTFIVNGVEKVMLSQLVRSPGVLFEWERDAGGVLVIDGERPLLCSVRIISEDGKGPWLKFDVGKDGLLSFSVWKQNPIPACVLFKWCGAYESDTFKGSPVEYDAHEERGWIEQALGRSVANEELDKARVEALYRYLNRGRASDEASMEGYLDRFFFKREGFYLGEAGRQSFAEKLGSEDAVYGEDRLALSRHDLKSLVSYLGHPESYLEKAAAFNGPGHLADKRVRRCGDFLKKALIEVLEDQFRTIRLQGKDAAKPNQDGKNDGLPDFIGALHKKAGVITRAVEREFAGNSLLQAVDQCNPLSGLTQKRRLSCFGPGGLTPKNIADPMRLVERSHYGRICPIETPEGQKVGVVTSLALLAKVDAETGAIKTPFRRVTAGKPADEAVWMSPHEEDAEASFIAEAHSAGGAVPDRVSCRTPRLHASSSSTPGHSARRDDYGLPADVPSKEVGLMDAAKGQMFSVSGSLIPFSEHDDAHRALMGANMQRQAIPLLYPEAPYVGTGVERRVAAECGVIPLAEGDGMVVYADAGRIVYETESRRCDVDLPSFERTNKGGVVNLRPLVEIGDEVREGQVLADGYATDRGELALGANLLAAYMCWEGYNYEDGIVISQRVLDEDLLTSVHVIDCKVELCDTAFKSEGRDGGMETLRDRIQSGAEAEFGAAGRNLDEEGIVRIGSEVGPGDVLVSRVTYEEKGKRHPSDTFLKAVKSGRDLDARSLRDLARRDCELVYKPLRVEDDVHGTVIGVKRRTDNLAAGVNEVITVQIAQIRKVEVGDKLAGRHGNKGVISKILPTHEMPFLADGTPIDIILNPLGVPSRLNVGQLYECALGWAAKRGGGASDDSVAPLPNYYECPAFEGPGKSKIDDLVKEANDCIEERCSEGFEPLMENGKVELFDGRTGDKFPEPVAVGYAYMMKLDHMVQDKMHARSTGPYNQVECQPLKGRSNKGGQRLGDMEGWAIEAYGASNLLHEMFTTKSDAVADRNMAEIQAGAGAGATAAEEQTSRDAAQEDTERLPETTEAFLMYLRALCLKPMYKKGDSEFKLKFARKDDMPSEAEAPAVDSSRDGEWPWNSEVNEFRLYDFTWKKPRPIEGGLLDESIFGSRKGPDKVSAVERRSRMGYIELACDDGHPIKHPWFKSKGPGDGDATIERLPVLPAELRPVVELKGGAYACSDLNVLYRNVITRNDTVKEIRLLKSQLAEELDISGSEKFEEVFSCFDAKGVDAGLVGQGMDALQVAVDQLLDNGHSEIEARDQSGRAYESLTDKISGKSGILRKGLLGKRIDYSGRSVIAPDPELAFDECGLPYEMAKTLFRPQLIDAWLKDGECHGGKRQAEHHVGGRSKADEAENRRKLERIMEGTLVLLNRAPTLHRMGIQAYRPVLTDDKAIKLHPLACTGFNADFDGDTMAVYSICGKDALEEARGRMLASLNVLSPANGEPLAAPSQDMVIGLYLKTGDEEGREEVFERIWDDNGGQPDSALCQAVNKLKAADREPPKIDERLDKKQCKQYVLDVCRAFADAEGLSVSDAVPVLDRIMQLGFEYASSPKMSGLTISYADIHLSESNEVDWIRQSASLGAQPPTCNPILVVAGSGARGKLDQLLQVVVSRGAMGGSYAEEIGTPIVHSLAQGVTPNEYWLSVYGSRRKVMDTALGTAVSGEFARTLVNAVQDVVITGEDCAVGNGLEVDIEGKELGDIKWLVGRYLATHAMAGASTLLEAGKCIRSIEDLKGLQDAGVKTIIVRSPLTCGERNTGICAKCYGWDLSKRVDVEVGDAVGIIAAQSLSEPATQLTLSNFHGGGAAGDDIIGGLPRIKQLLGGKEIGVSADRKSIGNHIIEEMEKQLSANKIDVNRKHIEVVVSEMLRDIDSGIAADDGGSATAEVRGIRYLANHPRALSNDSTASSFLAAAAVGRTRFVLTDAIANAGESGIAIDKLVGLKENLILGNQVPVGSGFAWQHQGKEGISEVV